MLKMNMRKIKEANKKFSTTGKNRMDLEKIILSNPDRFLHMLNKTGGKKTYNKATKDKK